MTTLSVSVQRADRPDTWPTPQRWGGVAALAVAATYVAGFAAMAAYLVPAGFVDAVSDPAGSVEFLLSHQAALYCWYLLLYLFGGAALVMVVIGVHDRVVRSEPTLSALATAFGLIWAGLLLASGMVALLSQRAVVELSATERTAAESTWVTAGVLQDALGGGIELVGALWVLMVAAATLRSRMFSRGLAGLGAVIGIAGLATLVPAAAEPAMSVFGLGFIVWFAWAGHDLLRR